MFPILGWPTIRNIVKRGKFAQSARLVRQNSQAFCVGETRRCASKLSDKIGRRFVGSTFIIVDVVQCL